MLPGSRQGPNFLLQEWCTLTGFNYDYHEYTHVRGLLETLESSHVFCLSSGNDLGLAFDIPENLRNQPFFASCVLKVFLGKKHHSNNIRCLTDAIQNAFLVCLLECRAEV